MSWSAVEHVLLRQMRDPKEVLTESGYREYQAHLHNIEAGLFYLINHADDLWLQSIGDERLQALYEVHQMMELRILEKGPFESADD